MSSKKRFHYNQQVAADIQYQVRPSSATEALRNAQLFNIVAVYPTAIVKRRPWFGFDRDIRMDDLLKPIIHDTDELKDFIDRFEEGQPLNSFDGALFDEQTIRSVFNTSRESRNLSIRFDVEMTQEEIAAHIKEHLHFERLSKLVERISRALKNEERGAILKLDVTYSPAFSF